ncbi:response regulator [Paraburkholderia sediminicola]|uniref:response regulator n=1 Tax=Paraburkholderia sediminicola TaxID=458836 RepID=UPI0038BA234C
MNEFEHAAVSLGDPRLDHGRAHVVPESTAIKPPYHVPRLLIVDQHSIVREGIKSILRCHTRVEIIAEAGDGFSALALCRLMEPDIIIMDLNLPALNGLELISLVRRRFARVRILVLSGEISEQQAAAAFDKGAHGYVLKQSSIDTVKEALLAIQRGRDYVDPYLSVDEIFALRQQAGLERREDSHNQLTARERQILKLIAEGGRNREIAERLHVSKKTVESHRTNLMQKLQAHNAAELSQWARRLGLIST